MHIDLSHYGLQDPSPRKTRRNHPVDHPQDDTADRARQAPPRRSGWRTLGVLSVGFFAVLTAWALPAQMEEPWTLGWVSEPSQTARSSRHYEPIIRHYAQWYGVDPALLTAMIRVESSFNPRAVSEKGALGLMQLMPDTISYWRITDPLNPYQNIRGGALQIRYLLHRFSDNLELAVAAYHAGATHVTRHDGIPPFSSTHQYVQRVLQTYQQLRPDTSRDL